MDGDIFLFLSRFFRNVCCVIEEKEKIAHVVENLSSWREGVQLFILQNWVS